MAEVIKISKIKPYILKDLSGTPYKRERVTCQFREHDEWGWMKRYIPANEAAEQWTAMIVRIGWLSKTRLDEARRFVDVEIVK